MREQFIKFVDENVDGCGTDVTTIAKVYGDDITVGTIDRIKDAICDYKSENKGEWDTDGCLEAAQDQFEAEGYDVSWINEEIEVDPNECAGKFDFITELFLLFQGLWDSTIKKSDLNRYGWDANPYVWVVEFERCKKPKEER